MLARLRFAVPWLRVNGPAHALISRIACWLPEGCAGVLLAPARPGYARLERLAFELPRLPRMMPRAIIVISLF